MASNRQKSDKRYHNTKKLLRNYKGFKKHCIECGSSLGDVENTLEAWELKIENPDEDYIKSAKRTKVRTQIIVDLIDRFIESHLEDAERRGDMNKMRRAEIVEKMYISGNKTMGELAEEFDCDIATISRQHKTAINELSVLFFGIEGMKLEV